MNLELQQKLLELNSNGYQIKIGGHPYVDEFAQIHVNENEEIVYSSQVFEEVPLRKVSEYDVYVYQPIDDWQSKTLPSLRK